MTNTEHSEVCISRVQWLVSPTLCAELLAILLIRNRVSIIRVGVI